MGNILKNEIKRSEEGFRSYERKLQATEAQLVKDKMASIQCIESQTNETIYLLEQEIQSLQGKLASSGNHFNVARGGADSSYLKILEIKDQLRRSKENEANLNYENMRMKYKINDLRLQATEKAQIIESNKETRKRSKALPNYFKETQRPRVILVVGEVLKRIFRRHL